MWSWTPKTSQERRERQGASPHDTGVGERDPDKVSSASSLVLHAAGRNVRGKELGYRCCFLQGGTGKRLWGHTDLRLNPAQSLSSWGHKCITYFLWVSFSSWERCRQCEIIQAQYLALTSCTVHVELFCFLCSCYILSPKQLFSSNITHLGGILILGVKDKVLSWVPHWPDTWFHSFIKYLFKCLLCARHCSRYLRCISEQKRKKMSVLVKSTC